MMAVAALMAIWWITEPIPLAATSLLPLVLFPFLGLASAGQAAAPYANHLIYLFLGGFMLAQAMQRWDLHRRLASLGQPSEQDPGRRPLVSVRRGRLAGAIKMREVRIHLPPCSLPEAKPPYPSPL